MLAIRLLQQSMLNRLSSHPSLSRYLIRYPFSINLTDEAQKAFIAQNALKIIRGFNRKYYLIDSRSIRNILLDKTYFKNELISLIASNKQPGLNSNEITMEWLDKTFLERNYQAVLEGFQYSKGAPYDSNIWPQDRMRLQSYGQRIVLFPVSTTETYFQRLIQGQSGILSGMKGTGKSFSFFTFSYLSNFKVQYFAKNQKNKNELLLYGKSDDWSNVTQICYINLKDKLLFKHYFDQIALQFTYLYSLQQFEKDILQQELERKQKMKKEQQRKSQGKKEQQKKSQGKKEQQKKSQGKKEQQKKSFEFLRSNQQDKAKQRLIIYLRNLNKRAEQHGIKLVCVIDEANRIFRLIRLLEVYLNTNGIGSQWKSTDQYKALKFYDQLLNIFLDDPKYKFKGLILNSSQDFQLKNAQDVKDTIFDKIINQVPFIKFACTLRNFGRPETTKYSEVMLSNSGKVELYNIFWFEILKYLRKRNILGLNSDKYVDLEKRISIHRSAFDNQFGLDKLSQKADFTQNIIESWANEAQHLSIRQSINSYTVTQSYDISFFSPLSNIFNCQKPDENMLIQFRKDLRKLKQYIGINRRSQIIQNIINYIQKATSFEEGKKRFKFLNSIFRSAQAYCIEREKRKQSNTQYTYLSAEKLTTNQQKTLVESIKIGYFKNETLKFDMSPEELVQILCRALTNRDFNRQMASLILKLLVDPKNNQINKELGKFLDRVSFPIFADGKFRLNYYEYEIEGQQKTLNINPAKAKKTSLIVNKTCPIYGIISLKNQCKDIFADLFRLADEKFTKQQYVGGYLVERIKNIIQSGENKGQGYEKKVQFQHFLPLQNNMLFDNVVLKKIKAAKNFQNAQYDMILYDWTMGRPGTKNDKDYYPIIEHYLNNSNIQADINCKLLIVAPDIYVYHYMSWWSNHRNRQKQWFNRSSRSSRSSSDRYRANSSHSYNNQTYGEQNEDKINLTLGITQAMLPDLNSYYQFTNQIKGVVYKRKITIRVASFDQNSPFQYQNHSNNSILINIVGQCYNLIKKKTKQKFKKRKSSK